MSNQRIVQYFRRILHWRRTVIAYVVGLMRWALLLGVAVLGGCSSTVSPATSGPPSARAITKHTYGVVDGREVDLYTLTNPGGLVLKVITYGATVTELHVPDKNGKLADVVLGFESLQGYVKGNPYMGVTVGRVANR